MAQIQTELPALTRAAPGVPCGGTEHGTPGADCGGGTAAGLSKPHIRTHELPPYGNGRLRWRKGGSLVEIKAAVPKLPPRERKRKKRGKVIEFSAAARSRLKATFASFKRSALASAHVVTLTYPAEFPAPDDFKVYKRHLHTFQQALRRKWPNCSGVWKLEFQRRGAAHYHLILFGLVNASLEEIRAWFRESWYRIAHNGDKNGGIAGTQVDTVKSAGGIMSYLVKYLSKGDQTMPGNFTGRYWGKHNENALPFAEVAEYELSPEEANQARRIARRKIQKDVEASRWKLFFKHNPNAWQMGSRFFWETGKSVVAGGAKHVRAWVRDRGGLIETEHGECYIEPHYLQLRWWPEFFKGYKYPRRWKPRNNETVRLYCDASAFVQQLSRLGKPASSFLEWSRGAQA